MVCKRRGFQQPLYSNINVKLLRFDGILEMDVKTLVGICGEPFLNHILYAPCIWTFHCLIFNSKAQATWVFWTSWQICIFVIWQSCKISSVKCMALERDSNCWQKRTTAQYYQHLLFRPQITYEFAFKLFQSHLIIVFLLTKKCEASF